MIKSQPFIWLTLAILFCVPAYSQYKGDDIPGFLGLQSGNRRLEVGYRIIGRG